MIIKEHQKTDSEIQQSIENKVFIVTGGNSGIGRETVHELARRKGKVYMACRDLDKCEEERTKIVLDTKNKYVYCRLVSILMILTFCEYNFLFAENVTFRAWNQFVIL